MHTHTVATLAWRWRRDPKPVEGLLRRVAGERLLLIGSGASDWLTSSGRAERHDGGWRINAREDLRERRSERRPVPDAGGA